MPPQAAPSPASCCICTFTQARARGKCLSVCHSLPLQWLGARRKDKSLGLMINRKYRKEMRVLSAEQAALGVCMRSFGCWVPVRRRNVMGPRASSRMSTAMGS